MVKSYIIRAGLGDGTSIYNLYNPYFLPYITG